MDPVEARIAERLAAVRDAAEVPPDLAARVVGAVHRRRRRRRRLTVAVGALAVVLIAVPVAVVTRPDRPVPPVPPIAARTPEPRDSVTGVTIPIAPGVPPELEAIVDRSGSWQIPVSQDGVPFRAESLAPDGTLAGHAGFFVAPYLTAPRAGVVAPEQGRVRWLPSAAPGYLAAAGTGLVAWVDQPDDAVVRCARAADDWRPVRLGTGLDSSYGLVAHRNLVAWTDGSGRAWASLDCQEPVEVEGEGEVAAVSAEGDPEVYLIDDQGRVSRTNLRTGGNNRDRRFPAGAFDIAVDGLTAVWADHDDGELVALYQDERKVLGQRSSAVTITVGRRLVVVTDRIPTGPHDQRSTVYDLSTGARIELRTEAFVAQDYLAWREGDHYTVAPIL